MKLKRNNWCFLKYYLYMSICIYQIAEHFLTSTVITLFAFILRFPFLNRKISTANCCSHSTMPNNNELKFFTTVSWNCCRLTKLIVCHFGQISSNKLRSWFLVLLAKSKANEWTNAIRIRLLNNIPEQMKTMNRFILLYIHILQYKQNG